MTRGRDGGGYEEWRFAATLVEWRGPAPFVFAPIPDGLTGEIHFAARTASYGWGCVPVEARVGDIDFTTSLFPRDAGYMLPVKLAVRRRAGVAPGDEVDARIRIVPRQPAHGRSAGRDPPAAFT